ncbi:MAG: hypothetical protein ABSF09_08980 [Candidatus Bathyarchaeia archaeon]
MTQAAESYERIWDTHCMNCGWRVKEFDKYKEAYNQLTKSACQDGDSKDVREACDQCETENTRYAHNWHVSVAKDMLRATD